MAKLGQWLFQMSAVFVGVFLALWAFAELV